MFQQFSAPNFNSEDFKIEGKLEETGYRLPFNMKVFTSISDIFILIVFSPRVHSRLHVNRDTNLNRNSQSLVLNKLLLLINASSVRVHSRWWLNQQESSLAKKVRRGGRDVFPRSLPNKVSSKESCARTKPRRAFKRKMPAIRNGSIPIKEIAYDCTAPLRALRHG